jgi:hypothetical protein
VAKLLGAQPKSTKSVGTHAKIPFEGVTLVTVEKIKFSIKSMDPMSYGPPWAHYLGGYQDRLLGGPLGLPGLRYTAPEGVEHKDYAGVVLG